jgi:hypothetical protein
MPHVTNTVAKDIDRRSVARLEQLCFGCFESWRAKHRRSSGCPVAEEERAVVSRQRSPRALPPFWYWCALVHTGKVRSGHGQAQKRQCLVAAIARRAERRGVSLVEKRLCQF